MPPKKTEIEKPPASKVRSPRISKATEKLICHIHDKVFDFEVDDIRGNVCVNDEPLILHTDGNHYCLFHLPSKEKDIAKFKQIFQARLKAVENEITEIEKLPQDEQEEAKSKLRYDFRYICFISEVDCYDHNFVISADFRSAIFSDDAYFKLAIFSDDVDFRDATFDKKSQIFFKQTKFFGALRFHHTSFQGYVEFEGIQGNRIFVGEKALLDLQNARIDDPKKISFHTVRLEPSWFINTDASEFVFTDCKWRYADDKRLSVKTELENLKKRNFENPYELLTKTCWQLAANAEDNNRFEEASNFRRMAFETEWLERKERIQKWWSEGFTHLEFFSNSGEKMKSLPFDLFHWGYRWSSGYGENRGWAFFVLFLIIVIAAILYSTSLCQFANGTDETRSLGFIEAVAYSLRVMVLQRPEPFPLNTFGKVVLALESVLAPLQAALLALAIRRKFMR